MTNRRPLVLISGAFSELPQGDSILGASVTLTANPSGLLLVGNELGIDAVALVSGAAAQVTANTALASGNAALADAGVALASGNAALASAATKYAISGGVVSGQFSQNIVSLGLYGSGINCDLGNYFTATLSGDTQVVITNPPASVAFGFTYEVDHQTGTITWPTEVEWPAATAPTLTTGKTHLFMFVTDDTGVTWRASSLIDYAS